VATNLTRTHLSHPSGIHPPQQHAAATHEAAAVVVVTGCWLHA